MTSTRDVDFDHDELYYKLTVSNKKIIFMMTLLKMYVFFLSNFISTFDSSFPGVSTILKNNNF